MLKEWYETRTDEAPDLLIHVTKGWFPYFTPLYDATKLLKRKLDRENLLSNFPVLADKEAFFDAITEDDFAKFKSWDQKVFAKDGTEIGTVENVYRYVLRLKKKYTAQDVKNAHRRIIIRWAPDKALHEDEQRFAARGFIIVQTAYEGLKQALYDKENALKKGFVVVERDDSSEDYSGEEVVTERSIVTIAE